MYGNGVGRLSIRVPISWINFNISTETKLGKILGTLYKRMISQSILRENTFEKKERRSRRTAQLFTNIHAARPIKLIGMFV